MTIPNVQELNVGINGAIGYDPIKLKQYDKNTRRIEITLIDDGEIVEIPSTYIAKFQATKKDNTIIFDDCEPIVNNVITYNVDEQLTSVAGDVECEIGLYEPDATGDTTKDKLIQSATFKILVKKSAMDRNAIISSNSFNTLTIAINSLTGAIAAEIIRVSNENLRISRESVRISSESNRVTAETGRVSAETTRVNNENARKVFETYNNTKAYIVGNKVVYNGSSYVNILACTGILPTSSTTNWLQTAAAGGSVINAVQLPITDTGNYYPVDDVNSALQNTGKRIRDIALDITMFGVIGNGITDDTIAVQSAIDYAISNNLSSIQLKDNSSYVISELINLDKVVFIGSNIKGLPATSMKSLKKYAPQNGNIFGTEYLSCAQNMIFTYNNIKVIFSGDSTTEFYKDTNDGLEMLLKNSLLSNGILNCEVINRGHSSQGLYQWVNAYVDATDGGDYLDKDLLLSPQLYILRWALNDSFRSVQENENLIREGLTRIRSQFSLSQMSIILMTPNSTNDDYNYRNSNYHEQMNEVYRRAARDYQCCFIDTYALWIDSEHADAWMDIQVYDGINTHIHPLPIMNKWIVSKIMECICPQLIKDLMPTNKILNKLSTYNMGSVSVPPGKYNALSIERCLDSHEGGAIFSLTQADGIGFQISCAVDGSNNIPIRCRYGTRGGSWSKWYTLGNSEILYGVSTARPSVPNIGEYFFDSTLNKPIWWNGISWVQYDGVTV